MDTEPQTAQNRYVTHIPETDHPELLPHENASAVPMSQELVDTAVDIWGDDNRIHVDPAMVQAFLAHDAVSQLFDADVPDGATIVPGAPVFAYEAVRQADEPVTALESDYQEIVDTADDVILEREPINGGEVVTYTVADTGDIASKHTLTYEEDPEQDVDISVVNGQRAYTVPQDLGLADQEGNVLTGINATFAGGTGRTAVEEQYEMPEKEDAPFNFGTDTYTHDDGTEITFDLLRFDDEVLDEIEDTYRQAVDDDVYLANPFAVYMETQAELLRIGREGMEELCEANRDIAQAMFGTYSD